MDELKQVYKSSTPFMNQVIAEHENVTDFLAMLRFISRLDPAANALILKGLDLLAEYQDNLRRVAQSYHKVVGEVVKTEENANAS